MQDTVIVGEINAGESAKVRAELEAAINVLNTSVFDVAVLLHKVRKGHHYNTVTFQDYLETLGIKVRKAQYLERIVDVMEAVGVPRAEYEPVGIAKLREIASLEPGEKYTNPTNNEQSEITQWIKDLLVAAKTSPLDDIRQSVRTLKGLTGTEEMTWLNLSMKRTVKDLVVLPAFEKARALLGTAGTDTYGTAKEYSDGTCLESICADFLSGE